MSDAQSVALNLHRRLKAMEENGKALRDVVASIAEQPGSERTIRAALRLLVRAYDEGIKDAG
jgi:hypothetical protein